MGFDPTETWQRMRSGLGPAGVVAERGSRRLTKPVPLPGIPAPLKRVK